MTPHEPTRADLSDFHGLGVPQADQTLERASERQERGSMSENAAMTAREPSAVEVIASPIVGWQVGGGGFDWASVDRDTALSMADAAVAALKAAGFVVARRDEIRAMSPTEQADLIGGEVKRFTTMKRHNDQYPYCVPRTCPHSEFEQHQERVIGPWVEVQP